MKKGGGKRKGSAFERQISKELSLWVSKGKRKDLFWRTHSSGYLGTVGKRKSEYGDIMAVDDEGRILTDHFNIECRHGKVIQLRHLFYGLDKSNIVSFIAEGRRNAQESGRMSLWFFKEQGGEPLVMMDMSKGYHKLWDSPFCLGVFPRFDVFVMRFVDWKREFEPFLRRHNGLQDNCRTNDNREESNQEVSSTS